MRIAIALIAPANLLGTTGCSPGDAGSPAAPKAISEEPISEERCAKNKAAGTITYRSGYPWLITNIDNGDALIWPAP